MPSPLIPTMPRTSPRPSATAPPDRDAGRDGDRDAADAPSRLPARAFLPFLGAAFLLANAYGASFLLPDALQAAGASPARAGTMIGAGTLATLAGALLAGRVVRRLGLMPTLVVAAAIMGLALAAFACVGLADAATGQVAGYLGGLLLGLGWALAYTLMPVQIIESLAPAARLEALTVLSGAQMVGIGLSTPAGRLMAAHLGGVGPALLVDALLCAAAVGLLAVAARAFPALPRRSSRAVALSLPAVRAILGGRTALPVAMIGLSACSFSGLSTFQSLLAGARGVPPEAFFLTFTLTTVTLRFSVASRIGRLPLARLALGLALAMVAGLVGLGAGPGGLGPWVAAALVYSVGYGLNYATLNALAVGLAEARGIAVAVASQVFTIGYFAGLFGFPLLAGPVLSAAGAAGGPAAGLDALLALMGAIALVNAALALALVVLRPARA